MTERMQEPGIARPPVAANQRVWDEIRTTLDKSYGDVGADIQQLRSLLTDTVLNLQVALKGLGARLEDGDWPLDAAADLARNDPPPRALSDDGPAVELADTTGRLVTALQFEDIATQILERTRRRLALIEVFTAEMLFSDLAHRTCKAAERADEDSLRRLQVEIEKHRSLARDVLAHVVSQTSMAPGEVELF